MNLVFTPEAWQDYLHWQATDARQVKRINLLLKEIARAPFGGIGKPEPLKHEYQGCWSRRIDGEHRVVYKVSGASVWLLQLRLHYRTAKQRQNHRSARGGVRRDGLGSE